MLTSVSAAGCLQCPIRDACCTAVGQGASEPATDMAAGRARRRASRRSLLPSATAPVACSLSLCMRLCLRERRIGALALTQPAHGLFGGGCLVGRPTHARPIGTLSQLPCVHARQAPRVAQSKDKRRALASMAAWTARDEEREACRLARGWREVYVLYIVQYSAGGGEEGARVGAPRE